VPPHIDSVPVPPVHSLTIVLLFLLLNYLLLLFSICYLSIFHLTLIFLKNFLKHCWFRDCKLAFYCCIRHMWQIIINTNWFDLMRTATGKEDPELPLLQRISSLELPAWEIASQINASESSSNRHISTWTVQRRLREPGLHGRIDARKLLLKDTNKNKRFAWAKKHKQWTLDR
jgi:hypothetical protein